MLGNSFWAAMKEAYNNGVLTQATVVGGKMFYVDPTNGSDISGTGTPSRPFASLEAGYAACTAGKNDTVILVADGTTAATARVDAAFDWAKNATHLRGLCPPTVYSQRSRIAPTAATTAFAAFFTVSGNGCMFENIQFLHDFSTDTTGQICLTVTGGRNVFRNCHIAGCFNGSDATARSLKISGGDENLFENCTIGVDTVGRSAANASVEFAAAAERNTFINCFFPVQAAAATVLTITAGSAGMANCQIFKDCMFLNYSATTQTALATLNAAAGGLLIFTNCTLVKTTGYGSDATTRGLSYVVGNIGTAGTSGIAVAPTA